MNQKAWAARIEASFCQDELELLERVAFIRGMAVSELVEDAALEWADMYLRAYHDVKAGLEWEYGEAVSG